MIRAKLITALVASSLGSFGPSAMAAAIEITDFGLMSRVKLPALTDDSLWAVDPEEGLVRAINFDVMTARLDLPNLPPKSRVRDLGVSETSDGVTVEVDFDCTCDVTSWLNEKNELIIEIFDLKEAQLSEAELLAMDATGRLPIQAAAVTKIEPTPSPRKQGGDDSDITLEELADLLNSAKEARENPPEEYELSAKSSATSPTRPREVVAPETPRFSSVRTPRRKPRAGAPIPSISLDGDEDEAIEALRSRVIDQLADAADRGVVTFAPDSNIFTQYVEDDTLHESCPDEEELDLRRLAPAENFHDPLGALRAKVYDLTRQVVPENVGALARHYLAFGLGAEARSVLASFDVGGESADLIVEMAEVIDNPSDKQGAFMLAKPNCGPLASVWRTAILSRLDGADVRGAWDDTVGSIIEFPEPLQKLLGARIGLGLHNAGAVDDVKRVWRVIEVAKGPEPDEMRLLRTIISSATEGELVRNLLPLTERRSTIQLDAAVEATRLLRRLYRPEMAKRVRKTLSDLAFLYGDSKDGDRATFAMLTLDSAYGELIEALATIDEREESQPERADLWKQVRASVVRDAMLRARPDRYAAQIGPLFEASKKLGSDPVSNEARVEFAETLIAAGASHLVDEVLSDNAFRREPEARLLLAEAAMKQGLPAKANALVGGLDSPEAEAIRFESKSIIGKAAAEGLETLFAGDLDELAPTPLARARELIGGTESDLSFIKEALNDG